MAEVNERVDVAVRPKIRARRRSEDRELIQPVPTGKTLLLAARWFRYGGVQVAERSGGTAPRQRQRQRPRNVARENGRARDLATERGSPLRILDRGAAELRRGMLADRELRDPAEHLAKT